MLIPMLVALQAPAAAAPIPPMEQPFGAFERTGVGAGLAGYIGIDDYPRESIRWNEQGMVGFRVEIAPDGRVVRCAAIVSSGFPRLDAHTCQLAVERLRFSPALDEAGKPTTDWLDMRIRWQLKGSGKKKKG